MPPSFLTLKKKKKRITGNETNRATLKRNCELKINLEKNHCTSLVEDKLKAKITKIIDLHLNGNFFNLANTKYSAYETPSSSRI